MANSNNVFIATPPKTRGTFFRAPLGTALPTDEVAALAAEYIDQGHVGEEGYAENLNRSTTDFKNFGGDVVASSQDDFTNDLTVTLLEHKSVPVLKTAFGDANVDDSGATIKVLRNKAVLPRSVFVVDVVGQDGGLERIVIPIGQVTTVGEIKRVHSDMVKYTLTIKCYVDAAGQTSYQYIEKTDGGS